MASILFLCTGNSCRSQMAEGFARHFSEEGDVVASAGIEAHGLNARAVAVMGEVDIDISNQQSNKLDEFQLEDFDVLVTVCGDADERCPLVPPGTRKFHWALPDPAKLTGADDAILAGFREVRDDIRGRVQSLFDDELRS